MLLPVVSGYFYIAINHMIPADYVGTYASERGEIVSNEKAMKSAFELGRETAQLAGTGFRFPEEFEKQGLAGYVTEKYGL